MSFSRWSPGELASGMAPGMPFLVPEANKERGFSHTSPPVRGRVAIKGDMSQKQEIYRVEKGKVEYFGFSVGPEGQDPLKVPPGGSGPERVCGVQKRLQAPYP